MAISKLQLEGIEPQMSSPILDRNIFTADAVTPTVEENRPNSIEYGPGTGLKTRALLAVTLLGAGAWYLLWKLALYFEAGR